MIPNDGGRVHCERTYAAGWIKRGPSGVIGTNKKDATETVELLLADARAGKLTSEGGDLGALLDERGVGVRRARRLAGDRRRRARRRRAARPAAGEAAHVGVAARRWSTIRAVTRALGW